ncbi:unnamed protein product [Vitrella brassicaformis CCMP3155]|uniref:Uncharacterized protein n=2 Tax=Vitrella brassicaformis TaxID=1169539 RepID=A0A0G4FEZ1_VITBC|nr:unnamed protein product [Vitrella brassicaformis CCMP3155]|eukprot:CEM11747.1 unnamed protein product [Vitrella brassicaformis CCMP3155]
MNTTRVKITCVGPPRSGKSFISNVLAEICEAPSSRYRPTVGVRIVEVEREKVTCELWDVSGDQRYSSCWPAIQQGVSGALFVYDAEVQTADLETWYHSFATSLGLTPTQCMLVCNVKRPDMERTPQPPGRFHALKECGNFCVVSGSTLAAFREAFGAFLDKAVASQEAKVRSEEEALLK